MHGNVWEWCADTYQKSYESAPNDGTAWTLEEYEKQDVMRGGSWRVYPEFCRSAARIGVASAPQRPIAGMNGFRCVVSKTV